MAFTSYVSFAYMTAGNRSVSRKSYKRIQLNLSRRLVYLYSRFRGREMSRKSFDERTSS